MKDMIELQQEPQEVEIVVDEQVLSALQGNPVRSFLLNTLSIFLGVSTAIVMGVAGSSYVLQEMDNPIPVIKSDSVSSIR